MPVLCSELCCDLLLASSLWSPTLLAPLRLLLTELCDEKCCPMMRLLPFAGVPMLTDTGYIDCFFLP